MLMSPLRTFTICGSSSMLKRRITLPTRVTRGSRRSLKTRSSSLANGTKAARRRHHAQLHVLHPAEADESGDQVVLHCVSREQDAIEPQRPQLVRARHDCALGGEREPSDG